MQTQVGKARGVVPDVWIPVYGVHPAGANSAMRAGWPGAFATPPGCVFHTRCPIAIDECKRVVPEWRNVGAAGKEHWVACIRV